MLNGPSAKGESAKGGVNVANADVICHVGSGVFFTESDVKDSNGHASSHFEGSSFRIRAKYLPNHLGCLSTFASKRQFIDGQHLDTRFL